MFGERIRQMRMAKGLSVRALAERMGCVSAQAISNYETDKDIPGSRVLLALADALGVQVSSFFQRLSVPLGEPAYRKAAGMAERKKMALQSQVAMLVEHHLEAESLFDLEVHKPLELSAAMKRPLATIEDAENRAEQLRTDWGLSDRPIENLVELLEEKGILVVCVDIDDKSFDGCTYPDAPIPVVVVKNSGPGDRLRLSLAHELGHLVLSFPAEWDEKQREKAAFRFGGAFLLPANRARAELGESRTSITPFELCELKVKYGLSVQAWVYRARDLGILSENAYRQMWMSPLGRMRGQEIGPICPIEQTSRHRRLVARAYADGRISESRAAEMLGVGLAGLPGVLMDGGMYCETERTAEAVGSSAL